MIHFDLIAPVGEILRRNARLYPEKLAFEDRRRSVSYARLDAETQALASRLLASGLKKGQAVAIFLPNSVNWVVACLAVVRAGGISVPVAIDSTEAELGYRLTDAGCSVLISLPEKRPMVECLLQRLGRPVELIEANDATVSTRPAPSPTFSRTTWTSIGLPISSIRPEPRGSRKACCSPRARCSG